MEDSVLIYQNRKLNRQNVWIAFLLFGWSYGAMDKLGMQLLFWITLGGLGFWALFRLFTLNSAIDEYNKKLAIQSGVSESQLARLGL